uniref:TATA-box binding protein associated factor 13 n=1 Tax=Aquila chrysaetos chrysaetos TaxID=223781 RepID=A0A663DTF0_AQUCH
MGLQRRASGKAGRQGLSPPRRRSVRERREGQRAQRGGEGRGERSRHREPAGERGRERRGAGQGRAAPALRRTTTWRPLREGRREGGTEEAEALPPLPEALGGVGRPWLTRRRTRRLKKTRKKPAGAWTAGKARGRGCSPKSTHKAMSIGRQGRVQVEDIVFLIRKDPRKFARVKDLLTMNEELKRARKAFDEANYGS